MYTLDQQCAPDKCVYYCIYIHYTSHHNQFVLRIKGKQALGDFTLKRECSPKYFQLDPSGECVHAWCYLSLGLNTQQENPHPKLNLANNNANRLEISLIWGKTPILCKLSILMQIVIVCVLNALELCNLLWPKRRKSGRLVCNCAKLPCGVMITRWDLFYNSSNATRVLFIQLFCVISKVEW